MATEICLEVMTTGPVLTEPTPDIPLTESESKNRKDSEATISLVAATASAANTLSSLEFQEIGDEESQLKTNDHDQPALNFALTEDGTQHAFVSTRTATVASPIFQPSTVSEPQVFVSDACASSPVAAPKIEEITAAVDIPNPAAHPIIACASPCHQPVSTETAITTVPAVFSIPVTPAQGIARSDSPPPSTHDDPPSKQDTLHRGNLPDNTTQNALTSSPAIDSASSVATPPVRRFKGARCLPVTAGHRGRHTVRLPKRAADRPTKSLRALRNIRAQKSQQANIPAAEPHRSRDGPRIPSLPSVFEETGDNEGLCSPKAPSPDMKEYNDEFDRELEALRPVFVGLDEELVEERIGGFTEATQRWVGRLEEHRAALAIKFEEFEINKDELRAYNDERQRLITSSFRPRDRIGSSRRSRRLDEISAAEIPLQKHRHELKADLEDLVMAGRAKLIKSLQMAHGVSDMIDEARHRAEERKAVETTATRLGISGAMLGLAGAPQEHDGRTQERIQQYTKVVVDQQLDGFDKQDKLHVPRLVKQADPGRSVPSHADHVFSKVPVWFPALDAKTPVNLHGATPLDRFKDLMRLLGELSDLAREEELTAASQMRKRAWNKEYHEPHPGWSSDIRRENGGWWACRSDDDAPVAKRQCRLCHKGEATREPPREEPSYGEQYRHLLREMEAAMAEQSKRDALMLRYQLQQEREDIDSY
ncbi:hypothetical protein VTJ83DRAFT_4817 [Remersonia thermophila]|uniref:Uncharacterized protein n=1 Tax=Remersonia thermophila TaxID=72144 RepID=A0ABR4DBS7_9PEZI